MPVYEIEIFLVRLTGLVQLRTAAERTGPIPRVIPDLDRFAVLATADDRGRAIRRTWRRLSQALPVVALWNAFPDSEGNYTLSFPLTADAAHRISFHAVRGGCTPETVLRDAIAEALARDRSSRRAQLDSRINALLRDFPRDEIKRGLSP
ncbi:hypothetical protein ACFWGI_31300 [Streptomyces niveus]|uniref:hypothetical protein n=1 Tax=Streptomyces niveus TaxID=193462 RepID=UPI0036608E09